MLSLFFVVTLASIGAVFPIPELGNCQSALDCWEYCDIMWHRDECVAYGKAQGLTVRRGIISRENGQVLGAQITYPISELGNCGSKEECKAYCDFEINQTACVNFARAHGIQTSYEASEGKAPVVRPPGVGFPVAELGNCGSVSECREYCSDEANRGACAEYARKMGIGEKGASKEEFEKQAGALGVSFPIKELGNCSSPDECREFCDKRNNFEKCEKFAKGHGLVVEVEGPGGCKGREECESFCSKRENMKTCMEWARKHGMEDESHTGPGGCMSQEECEKYCEEHPDDEECHWEQDKMEEYCKDHPDDEGCKKMAKYGPMRHGRQGPGEGGGPGGCRNSEECEEYCESHPDSEECFEFWGDQEYRGPGVEDRSYDEENWEKGERGEHREGGGLSEDDDYEYEGSDPRGIVDERARYCKEHPGECQ